jgi:GLPGLI family protein
MMTRRLIIYALLFFSANMVAQQQIMSGEIQYEFTITTNDSISNEVLKKNKVSDQVKKMLKTLYSKNKASYLLRFHKNASIFKAVESLSIEENKMNYAKIMGGNGIFYTDKNADKILDQKEAYGQLFLVSIPKPEWSLTQETKTIGKYLCYKATTKQEAETRHGKVVKKITAWYTPEIPINYGPKNFYGLPGLIIELEIAKGSLFRATNINLSLTKEIKIKKPTRGKKLSLQEFEATSKKLYESFHSNKLKY